MVHLAAGCGGRRGRRDRSALRRLAARAVDVEHHAIGVGQGEDPVIVHGHQVEGDQNAAGRSGTDLDLGQDPVLDGARGHDIGSDAGLLQDDLQLFVAAGGRLHQDALVMHVLGHVHDHAGVVGARPVADAEQGQPVLELGRRGGGLLRRGGLLGLRRGGPGGRRRCGLGALGRPGALELRQPFPGLGHLVALGIGLHQGLEDPGGLGRILELLLPDEPHAEQGVIGPAVPGVGGQHAVVGLQGLEPVGAGKGAPGQLLVASAEKEHAARRELALGIGRQGTQEGLHDRFPLGPQAGPFLVGQQGIEGAHAARVLALGRSQGHGAAAQHQGERKNEAREDSRLHHSTVTDLARLRGWSTSLPRYTAIS